jgi:hypothetical protein
MKKIWPGMILSILLYGSSLASNWWEDVKIKGDLRYRHEMIDEHPENVDSNARNRQRIRARIGIESRVNDNVETGIQLATGSDDPVSTNQTLDNGFSTKNLMLDLAYLSITPAKIDGLKITGGKFNNPFFKPGKSELLWDSDLNPEGGVVNYTRDFEQLTATLIGAGLWIEERSSEVNSWMGAVQGVLGMHFDNKKTDLALGGAFFNYSNSKGFEPFFDGDPMGNTVDSNGDYANDYELIEAYAEVVHEVKEIPVTIMGDLVTNSAADSLGTGWLVGFRIGEAKKPGTWHLRYNYREVQKDAVVGTFTDSDFRGGGTDAQGHEMGGTYQIAENLSLSMTYFINTIGLEEPVKTDFRRLQIDLQAKF